MENKGDDLPHIRESGYETVTYNLPDAHKRRAFMSRAHLGAAFFHLCNHNKLYVEPIFESTSEVNSVGSSSH